MAPMPLEILATIVPIGIIVVVLVVRYSGLSKSANLLNGADACNIFLKDFPGLPVSQNVILTKNHEAAFIKIDDFRALGLVEAIGDRYITRIFKSNDIASFDQPDPLALTIRYNEFTHPRSNYLFDAPADLSTLWGWLNELKSSDIDDEIS